jgi:3-hydroxybutyrate dehydrogenase
VTWRKEASRTCDLNEGLQCISSELEVAQLYRILLADAEPEVIVGRILLNSTGKSKDK